MRDGQRVSYIGDGRDGLNLGDKGQVLVVEGRGSHVLWSTGARSGEVDLIDNFDLAAQGKGQTVASFDPEQDDSLEVGGLHTTAVRDLYDADGEAGVLNWMVNAGHTASFQAVAEEAHSFIVARLRQDPSFQAVANNLDEEEHESVIRLAASVLLRDAFGEGE